MELFSRAPFVRLLFPFIVGILIGIQFRAVHAFIPFLPLLFLLFVVIYFIVGSVFKHKRVNGIFGISVFLLLIALGYQLTIINTDPAFGETHKPVQSEVRKHFVRVKIISSSIERLKSFKAIAELESIKERGNWMKVKGKALIYFRKNQAASAIEYGNQLLLYTYFSSIAPAPNPGMFDYGRYLADRNILYEAFVDTQSWRRLADDSDNHFMKLCNHWRNLMLQRFQQGRISNNEYAVGSALLLGYEDKLDAGIMASYTGAGVLHILSVSGLHVAIVYAVFNGLLFFMERRRYGVWIKAMILLCLLWLYAGITGFSPAVLRSVAMISFVVVAHAMRRNSNIFNTLAASAFFLLCVDPFMIMDAGFELSYLAVGGILIIHPLLYQKDESRSWITNQAYALITVSIAAQLATFPLSIYYFHQFPLYFLFANLAVIPLSTVVIYSGIAFLVLSQAPFLSPVSAWVFRLMLTSLNASVDFFSHLPGASLKGLYLSGAETILLYLLVLMFILYFKKPHIDRLKACLWIGILFVFTLCLDAYKHSRQNFFIVYSTPHHTAIDLVSGHSRYTIADSGMYANKALELFCIQPFRDKSALRHAEPHLLPRGLTSYTFNGKRLLIVNGKPAVATSVVLTDYLILSSGAMIGRDELGARYRYKTLIIDSSCSSKEIFRWKKIIAELELNAWVVNEEGAFLEDI